MYGALVIKSLTGQPAGDGSAPTRLLGAVRRRIQVERRSTQSAAHIGRILSSSDDAARSRHMVHRRPDAHAPTLGSHRSRPWLGRSVKNIGEQFDRRIPLPTWAAAVDPADVPTIRSASVTSNPAPKRPAMTPISHAFPADPPPPRTNARSLMTGHSMQPQQRQRRHSAARESSFIPLPRARGEDESPPMSSIHADKPALISIRAVRLWVRLFAAIRSATVADATACPHGAVCEVHWRPSQ